MTYLSRELSVQDGQPVELYIFAQGNTVWRYTTGVAPMTVDGNEFEPAVIVRSDVSQTGEMNREGITLTMPRTHEFASQFLGYAPDRPVIVTLMRVHSTDGDLQTIVYWKGRITACRAGGSEVILECESVFTSLRRPGLRARYQRTCRHSLYGPGCGLDPEAFAVTAQVFGLSANHVGLTVPAAGAYSDGYFTGGMVRGPDGVLRFLVNHVGSMVTLARPLESLTDAWAATGYGLAYGFRYGGLVVELYPGCDLARTTCSSKFGNLNRYGGFPYIPIRNPFDGSSIV